MSLHIMCVGLQSGGVYAHRPLYKPDIREWRPDVSWGLIRSPQSPLYHHRAIKPHLRCYVRSMCIIWSMMVYMYISFLCVS